MTDKAIRAAKLTAAGILDKARARTAVTRAGGQIAPSKYLPDVPRQVHADGGKVAFMQGNHPDVPDVVYHGNAPQIAYKGWTSDIDHEQTQKNLEAQNFREFKPSGHGSYGAGIYLSDSPKVASDFAQSIRSDQKEPQPFGQVLKLHVSMKQPFTDDTLRHPEWKAYIKRALTRMSLPKQYEDDIAHRDAFLKALNKGNATVRDLFLRESQHGTMVNQFGQDDIHSTIRNSGFDGIIAHRPDGSKEYVAFKPEQVKSATGNQGTFDPNDPDITKAGGGDVEGDDDGITAYHSSPHDFDQFDVSKLGTGEGNQSYGPGLYFAENPKVSDRGGQYWNQFMNRGRMTPEKKAAFALQMAGWDRDKAADRLQKRMEDHIDRAIPGKYGNGPLDEEGNRLLAQETQEAIDHVRSGKILGPRTYKVKLNVKPHELIDWDEPLSEQHPNIQAVLGSGSETAGSKLSRVNRNPYYRGDIIRKETATLQELYDHFRSKGIKGIRYNDAGSRHGSNGDGTKNYVMFHHDPVKVVDKYEYGGTIGKEEGGEVDDNQPNNVVNLGFKRAMKNVMSDEPPQHVQDVLNHVQNRFEASRQAYLEAKADGAFDRLPFGDKYRYKPTPNSTPMEVVGHRMMHVSRWGNAEPPKLVYQDHYPVVDLEPVGQPAYTRPCPVELLLNNPDKYEHISGKPRLVKRKGGAVGEALALTRRFTKDGKAATMALKPKGK